MRIELTREDAEVLEGLLAAARREHLHQIHHADSRAYRKRLEQELERIEAIEARLLPPAHAA
jgi:hypothetical protein